MEERQLKSNGFSSWQKAGRNTETYKGCSQGVWGNFLTSSVSEHPENTTYCGDGSGIRSSFDRVVIVYLNSELNEEKYMVLSKFVWNKKLDKKRVT